MDMIEEGMCGLKGLWGKVFVGVAEQDGGGREGAEGHMHAESASPVPATGVLSVAGVKGVKGVRQACQHDSFEV